MADVNVGMELGLSPISPSSTDKEKIDYLMNAFTRLEDAYVRMKRDLENALQTIDSSNVTEIDAERVDVKNLTAGNIVAGSLVVGDTVGQGTAPRSFTATPTTPYSIGDIWTGGSAGDMKRCTTARASGAYVAGDWTLATKYTDDSNVTTIVGNTITTGYVNALQVTAGSVAAENITGSLISGKKFSLIGTSAGAKIEEADGMASFDVTNYGGTPKGSYLYNSGTNQVVLGSYVDMYLTSAKGLGIVASENCVITTDASLGLTVNGLGYMVLTAPDIYLDATGEVFINCTEFGVFGAAPAAQQTASLLPGGATLSDVIIKINGLITRLSYYGLITIV